MAMINHKKPQTILSVSPTNRLCNSKTRTLRRTTSALVRERWRIRRIQFPRYGIICSRNSAICSNLKGKLLWPVTSQTTYMQDMTPTNRTRYRRATPPPTNQNKTNRAVMPRSNNHELSKKKRQSSSSIKNASIKPTASLSSPTKGWTRKIRPTREKRSC